MKTILEVVRDLIKPYIDINASNIATVEDSTVENPYYVGDQLIYKGVLYNVTADISIGDTLEIGTNIAVAPKLNSSVKSILNKLKSDGTSSGTDFNFDIQNGVPGWNSATNRDSSTFHPFSPGSTASDISYDNTTSGLTATDVQDAIDEMKGQYDSVDTEISDMNNILGAKNILDPYYKLTNAWSGITWTFNSDGSITASGTPSDEYASYSFCATSSADIVNATVGKIFPKAGKYMASLGDELGPSGSGALGFVEIYKRENNTKTSVFSSLLWNEQKEVLVEITDTMFNDPSYFIAFEARVYSRVESVHFYPMIRPASIINDTYAPFTMTNRQLAREMYKSNFTSNGSATFSGSTTWTVPEDGLYALILQTMATFGHDAIISVGSIWIAHDYFSGQYRCLNVTIPLKKGVVIKFELTGNASGSITRTRISS